MLTVTARDGTTIAVDQYGKPLSRKPWATGAEAIAEVLPNAQRRTLPGQTPTVEPDEIAPVLREFFTD